MPYFPSLYFLSIFAEEEVEQVGIQAPPPPPPDHGLSNNPHQASFHRRILIVPVPIATF